jgi:hypothetical protein
MATPQPGRARITRHSWQTPPKNHLENHENRVTLYLRLLLLYRLWVCKAVARSHLRPFLFYPPALRACRTKLEDGRSSVEGLGT